ncbi:DM13 domain-containing protein [Catenuloplanes sp. NPDC051500]|uniref:DM13 domain-containing protein n=1 Tax=Catenuloplanes sp. NPDC051500 TaxID=3363959 RepID=UPI0037AD04E7
MIGRLRRSPLAWVAAALLACVAGAGIFWFEPWKLVTDQEVAESLTVVPAPQSPAVTGSQSPAASGSATPAPAAPAVPAVVRQGEFISHEHDTTGVARVVRAADGSHTLELAGLDTSNGPDLRVWLSDQPVRAGTAGWRVFDDGEWVELGELKGNRGDQTYAIPAGTDLDRLSSVTIWCIRFSVSFGAADLARP